MPEDNLDATCPRCGKLCEAKELEPQPDPYAQDINDDDTDVVQCNDCRSDSAMEI